MPPSFLDACLVHSLVFDFMVNGRRHTVVRVLAVWVIEYLDVVKHVLPFGITRDVSASPEGCNMLNQGNFPSDLIQHVTKIGRCADDQHLQSHHLL